MPNLLFVEQGGPGMLTRLIYHSENHLGSAGSMISDLNGILEVSNRNNEKAGITGALIFDSLWFVQILEGEREAVSQTLCRIVSDPRHDAVTIMDCRPADKRLFGNWWMGLAFLSGNTEALFAPYGLKQLNPRRMSGEQIVTIASELSSRGLNRKLASA
jgi:hypothetical protein